MQRNWIGRSDGALVAFPGRRRPADIEVFTTRPDTLFGATFMVLAPEHPLVDALTPTRGPRARRRLDGRCGDAGRRRRGVPRLAASKTDVERQAEGREKTGVFTGATRPTRSRRADPDLHRRLRADGLRHRGDHGRARPGPARLRVRRGVRPADRPHRAAAATELRRARPYVGDGPGDQQRASSTASSVADGEATIIDWLDAHGHGEAHGHLQAARLAVQPPALLGRAVPDRLRRRRPADRAARRRAAGGAARDRRLLAAHVRPDDETPARAAARPRRRLGGRRRARPRRRPAARTGARRT